MRREGGKPGDETDASGPSRGWQPGRRRSRAGGVDRGQVSELQNVGRKPSLVCWIFWMFGVNSEMEIEVIEREPAVQGLQKTLTERELALDQFTDLQSAVEALQKTQEALRESLAATSEVARKDLADQNFALDQHAIVAMTDVQGRITYVNDKFCAVSKYSREELLGQDHRIVNSGYHPKEFFQNMYRTVARGGVWHGEIRNRAKDGSIYWVDATIVGVVGVDGKLRQYVAIRADITERVRAQQELASKVEELARSNRELEQFAYVASHDLQEPLRMVASYTQLLSERYSGKLDDNGDKFLGYAREGALRMQVLIKDLLAFSRVVQAGIPRKPVDCNVALEEAVQSLTAAIEESGAVVTHAALPNVWADQTQIAQVFQNLIGNAIKFHDGAPPECAVSAEKSGRNWLFSVSDNGIGIAPEYAENIFVVFQRLHARTEYPGNGMGLAICKKIIQHYGGTIWVESQVGQGSTFKFTLPAAAPEEEGRARS